MSYISSYIFIKIRYNKGMQHQIIILIGPPGSGKGTQANLLADDFGFYHFEFSKVIEDKFASADPNDAVISKEKLNFKEGRLVSPTLVGEWSLEKLKDFGSRGQSIVFSSSFRTPQETEYLIPIAEQFYGKDNIHVVHIKVSEQESVYRNVNRRICKANRHPIPNFPEFKEITECPKDGSELVKRILDSEETMKVRYATFLKETEPVFDYFRKRRYNILEVNGEQTIRNVHNDIMTGIHRTAHPDLEAKLQDSA